MGKTFRCLLQLALGNLGVLLAFAAVVTLGCLAPPWILTPLFLQYFGLFPHMGVLILYLFAYALCTTNLNLALSFGGRRRDFFWALQGLLLVYTGELLLLRELMGVIRTFVFPAAGWKNLESLPFFLPEGTGSLWVYPLVCLTALALGCLSGLVCAKSRVWGAVLIIATCVGSMAAIALLLITGDGSWETLSWRLALGMGAVILVSELVIWRGVSRAVVR